MISEKPLCYPTLGAPQFCLKPPLATGEDKNWKRGLEERIGRDRKWELRKATEPPNPPRKGSLGRVPQTLCQPWLRSQGGDGRGDVLHLSSLSFLICKLGLMTLNERGGWGGM